MRGQLITAIIVLAFIYTVNTFAQTRTMRPLFANHAADSTNQSLSTLIRVSLDESVIPQIDWPHSGPYAGKVFHAERQSARMLLACALVAPIERVFSEIPLPTSLYDCEVIVPKGSESLLLPLVQQTIQTELAVSARWEYRETDLAILERDSTKPLLLTPSNPTQMADIPAGHNSKLEIRTDHGLVSMVGINTTPEGIASVLQATLGTIVLDQTHSKQHGNLELQWKQNDWNSLQEALGKLGFRLTKARRSTQLVVVRPVSRDSKGK